MNQINAVINIRATRIHTMRETLHARQLHSFVAKVVNIPDDVTSVILRVFKTDGVAHFDIPVSRGGEVPATGVAYIIGTCFPAAGDARYELHAYDARGNMTALGEGLLRIDTFSSTGTPLVPGQSVPVMQITDATGALHTIKAVPDEDGNYTTILDA